MLDQFVSWATSQGPLLFPGQPEKFRGECYQLINFYLNKVWGRPLIYRDYAYQLLDGARAAGTYEVVANDPNDPNQLPPIGAVVVFSTALPGSGGMGHTDIFLQAVGTAAWVGLDANWGGKVAHKVAHNWNYVAGWFYPKAGQGAGPVPASIPTVQAPITSQGGDEMIVNQDQAVKAYGLLRLEGGPSQDEINGTAGKRSWAQFANDAQPEVAQRNSHFKDMQTTINNQNQVITDLTIKLTDTETTAAFKQAALTDALAKIASDNADMASLHDQIAEFNNNPVVKAQNAAAALAKKPSNAAKFLASIISAFSKFNFSKKK